MEKERHFSAVKNAMLCMTRQCWEQGILAQSLWETGDYGRLNLIVHDMVLRQSKDGRLCNVENTPAVTDSSFCIPSTYLLGKKLGREDYAEAARKNVKFLLEDSPRSGKGILYHIKGMEEVWADSAAFLPYSLALAGYPEEGLYQMRGILEYLKREDGLYQHIWDEGQKRFRRPLAWGIGNGWILTGLFRLCQVLQKPEERSWAKTKFVSLLNKILEMESTNHLFYDVLDDPQTFEETEVSEMVAYSIYLAVAEGMLSRDYLTRAEKIREAILLKITDEGLVMDCSSSPEFLYPGTAVEGQAHFLMMEQARNNTKKEENMV